MLAKATATGSLLSELSILKQLLSPAPLTPSLMNYVPSMPAIKKSGTDAKPDDAKKAEEPKIENAEK
jgi:hypothetical protein